MSDIPQEIIIEKTHLAELERHAQKSLPRESCAFLLGKGTSQVVINDILLVQNIEADSVSFAVPAEVLLEVYRLAEKQKLQVVAIFHSHPSRAEPSSTDAEFMEINPVVWVIYSTTEHRFSAWVLEEKILQVNIVMR